MGEMTSKRGAPSRARGDRRLVAVLGMMGLALGACAAGCVGEFEEAGGFIGVVDGQEFTIRSGRAEPVGDGLEIILSDAEGDGCDGGLIEPVGNRKVILSANEAAEGRYATSEGAQISIQIKNDAQVFTSRDATGSFQLELVELTEGGEVSGTVSGVSDEGDDLDGSFFVTFCP